MDSAVTAAEGGAVVAQPQMVAFVLADPVRQAEQVLPSPETKPSCIRIATNIVAMYTRSRRPGSTQISTPKAPSHGLSSGTS